MQKRFVSWAAVSSLPQAKKISLEDQLKTNQEHVARWDGMLVEELVVPGESRNIVLFEDAARKMDAYARLRELIDRRAFDVFIYFDRSRLGRQAALIMAVTGLCHEAGIVTYATESPPTALDPPGHHFHNSVVGAIESVMAQEEVSKIQHRHEMGMMQRVRNGEFPNHIPHGWLVHYEAHDGKPVQILEVDEQFKEALLCILDLFLHKSYSVREIGRHLKDKGFPPPKRGEWTRSAVQSILRGIWRYAGYNELNRRSKKRDYIREKSKWPALIPEEDARAVIAEMNRRYGTKRSAYRSHRFSGLVWCQRCQAKMIAHYGHYRLRSSGEKVRSEAYQCLDLEGQAKHPKNTISNRFIEQFLRAAFTQLQDKDFRRSLLTPNQSRVSAIEAQIHKAQMRLTDNDNALQRADDAFVMGSMTPERYQRQVAKLSEQRAKMEAEITRLQDDLLVAIHDNNHEQRLEDLAANGIAMLDTDDLPTANAYFRRHIQVWINNDDEDERIKTVYL